MLTKLSKVLVLLIVFVVLPVFGEEKTKVTRRVLIKDGQIFSNDLLGEGDVIGHGPFMFSRVYVGVSLTTLTPELRAHFGVGRDSGVLVSKVTPDSPAARGGLKAGDIITSIDGLSIKGPGDLSRAINKRKAGEQVKMELTRDRVPQQLFVAVAEREMEGLTDIGVPFGRAMEMAPMAKETAERLERFFKSPEWQAKLDKVHDCGELRGRLRELETRLKDLEKRLEKK